ncbi:hypothetical protein Daus18300_014330 [Diaporthe australafricana]|uniref:Uncharacterized protein n=1 Tax=Diaporthe australafricana TaxID=127596 RepID=A0ABR3VVK9_9PEZI
MDPSLLWPGPFTTRAPSILPTLPGPFWQNITDLAIVFDARTPSGEWYFCAPDGIDIHNPPFFDPSQSGAPLTPADTDVLEREIPPGYDAHETQEALTLGHFDFPFDLVNSGWAPTWTDRLVPEERPLLPLIEAWARALSQMPRLRRAELKKTLRLPVVKTTLRLPVFRRGGDRYYD